MKNNYFLTFLFISFLCIINTSSLAFAQKLPRIINEGKIKISQSHIKEIISMANNISVKNIDKICIGVFYLPGGLDSTLISVWEKENIIKDVIVNQRYLTIKDNTKLEGKTKNKTKKFSLIAIDTLKRWRAIFNRDTINVIQNRSLQYQEVYRIIKLLYNNKYINQTSIKTFNPRKDINKIARIEREGNYYKIYFDNYGTGYALRCLLNNNELQIKYYSYWLS